ncbi:MAG: hemerythrin domain-containing protein [Acidimicrobiales bacterium]
MTITQPTTTTPGAFRLVAVDLYRDIHKAIRAELFATTVDAGRVDPADRSGRQALAHRVDDLVDLLVTHAEHEDSAVQPTLEIHLPKLAERIECDHAGLESRMLDLRALATADIDAAAVAQRTSAHHLYLELASFTSAYLEHQDLEERVVMSDLDTIIGVEAVGEIHAAIIGSIPPDVMANSLALMLPVMNIEDRAELLGGMQAGAPAEVFAGVWGLAGSVLDDAAYSALTTRLGLD